MKVSFNSENSIGANGTGWRKRTHHWDASEAGHHLDRADAIPVLLPKRTDSKDARVRTVTRRACKEGRVDGCKTVRRDETGHATRGSEKMHGSNLDEGNCDRRVCCNSASEPRGKVFDAERASDKKVIYTVCGLSQNLENKGFCDSKNTSVESEYGTDVQRNETRTMDRVDTTNRTKGATRYKKSASCVCRSVGLDASRAQNISTRDADAKNALGSVINETLPDLCFCTGPYISPCGTDRIMTREELETIPLNRRTNDTCRCHIEHAARLRKPVGKRNSGLTISCIENRNGFDCVENENRISSSAGKSRDRYRNLSPESTLRSDIAESSTAKSKFIDTNGDSLRVLERLLNDTTGSQKKSNYDVTGDSKKKSVCCGVSKRTCAVQVNGDDSRIISLARSEFLQMLTEIKEHADSLEQQLTEMGVLCARKIATRGNVSETTRGDDENVCRTNDRGECNNSRVHPAKQIESKHAGDRSMVRDVEQKNSSEKLEGHRSVKRSESDTVTYIQKPKRHDGSSTDNDTVLWFQGVNAENAIVCVDKRTMTARYVKPSTAKKDTVGRTKDIEEASMISSSIDKRKRARSLPEQGPLTQTREVMFHSTETNYDLNDEYTAPSSPDTTDKVDFNLEPVAASTPKVHASESSTANCDVCCMQTDDLATEEMLDTNPSKRTISTRQIYDTTRSRESGVRDCTGTTVQCPVTTGLETSTGAIAKSLAGVKRKSRDGSMQTPKMVCRSVSMPLHSAPKIPKLRNFSENSEIEGADDEARITRCTQSSDFQIVAATSISSMEFRASHGDRRAGFSRAENISYPRGSGRTNGSYETSGPRDAPVSNVGTEISAHSRSTETGGPTTVYTSCAEIADTSRKRLENANEKYVARSRNVGIPSGWTKGNSEDCATGACEQSTRDVKSQLDPTMLGNDEEDTFVWSRPKAFPRGDESGTNHKRSVGFKNYERTNYTAANYDTTEPCTSETAKVFDASLPARSTSTRKLSWNKSARSLPSRRYDGPQHAAYYMFVEHQNTPFTDHSQLPNYDSENELILADRKISNRDTLREAMSSESLPTNDESDAERKNSPFLELARGSGIELQNISSNIKFFGDDRCIVLVAVNFNDSSAPDNESPHDTTNKSKKR